ncbi:FAD-dependent oxidoreductase [Paenibacillus sp. F411]|uniref:dihydrolipoyl dehydrogenase family protein n=1 Tax=Paenibacillus sp. F411 TaxID=2820239 RepID=UPI001AAEF275|nr:FAD-dependent oxidoreductase [Paenibacillus sp. F411]MBO2942834.1 FAD-dependent oxidoreductase [Paenibacillus sp. F411]
MKKYDLIVIGAGSGGLTAAVGAIRFGIKVALIDKDAQPGGDCLHTGCVPSKALIAAANDLHDARKTAEGYGLSLTGEADYLEAYRRVQAAKAVIAHHDAAEHFESMGIDVYQGHAKFLDNHAIQIDGQETLQGKRIIIAAGSRAKVPDIEGLKDIDYLTNESVFDMMSLPKRLVVIGAGPVGLELSQALARLGSQVTLLVKGDSLFPKEDHDIAARAQSLMEQEMSIVYHTEVQKVAADGAGVKTIYGRINGHEHTWQAEGLLIATGRMPNTDQLDLHRTSVELDGDHIAVQKNLRTTARSIFAIGDVIKPFPFTHAAGMEGKVAVSNAVFGLRRKVSYDAVPWVTYTEPEIFHLGMTEKEAREQAGDDIQIYITDLKEVDRFITDRSTEGLVKIIADQKGKIMGAHAVGKGAGNWMQEAVFAKQHGCKVSHIAETIHPYPTHGEALKKASGQYWEKKLFDGPVYKLLKAYVKWFR